MAYAFLLTISDVFSFIIKPLSGFISDKHGERVLLLSSLLLYVISIYLIGQTSSVLLITLLQILAGIANAFLLSVIIIFALRHVKEKPDSKVGLFGGLMSSGWIFGLLIPGFIIENFGMSSAFLCYLIIGLLFFFLVFRFSKVYKVKPVKHSLSFIKKVPMPLIYKTVDMAVFNAFVIFFIRYGIKSLGVSPGVLSLIIAFESLVFSLSDISLGRLSNHNRRRFWIPIGMCLYTLGILAMIFSTTLSFYLLAAFMIGVGGSFIDIWVYSYISDNVEIENKGKVIGTVGWSYDFGTIFGAQVPAAFSFLAVNPFTSMLLFPLFGIASYIAKKRS